MLRFDASKWFPIRAIIDTGCELDGAIDQSVLMHWQITPQLSSTVIHGATGSASGVPHVRAHLRSLHEQHRLDLAVLPLPGVQMLLGMGFLHSVGAVISLAERTVSWTSKSGREVCLRGIRGPDELPVFRPAEAAPPGPSEEFEVTWSTDPVAADEVEQAYCSVIHDPDTNVPSLLPWAPEVPVEQVMLHMLQGDPKSPSPGPSQHSNYGESFLRQTESRLASARTTDHIWLLLEEVDDVIKHCPPELQSEFRKLILKYESSVFEEREFPRRPPDRGPDHRFRIHLEPGTTIPPSPLHKLSPALVEFLRGMLLELLQDGLISPNNSPFTAPALLVRKPDGKYRLVIDYRKLIQLTIKDWYALPTAESVFDRFGGAADTLHSQQQYRPSRVLSTLDLRWAYYQIPMDP